MSEVQTHSVSIDLVEIYARIRAACSAAGSQRKWAASLGVSDAYVSAVLNALKAPSPAMLAAIGFRRVVRYVPLKGHQK